MLLGETPTQERFYFPPKKSRLQRADTELHDGLNLGRKNTPTDLTFISFLCLEIEIHSTKASFSRRLGLHNARKRSEDAKPSIQFRGIMAERSE